LKPEPEKPSPSPGLWSPARPVHHYTEPHQVAMVLALGLIIRDIMCVVEIEPDQCPPGMPEWVASSALTVQDVEALLKMVPVLTRLNER